MSLLRNRPTILDSVTYLALKFDIEFCRSWIRHRIQVIEQKPKSGDYGYLIFNLDALIALDFDIDLRSINLRLFPHNQT